MPAADEQLSGPAHRDGGQGAGSGREAEELTQGESQCIIASGQTILSGPMVQGRPDPGRSGGNTSGLECLGALVRRVS